MDQRTARGDPPNAFAEGELPLALPAAGAAISVLLPYAVDAPYTYRAPKGVTLAPGDIVTVPLATREVTGVVWDDPPDAAMDPARLRAVAARFDVPPLAADLRRFIDWVAHYTLSTRGMVLRMVLRVPAAFEPERPLVGVRLAGPPPARMTPARQRVLDILADGLAWSRSGLAAAAAVSPGVVGGLVDAGTLEEVEIPPPPAAQPPDPDHAIPALSETQAAAAAALTAAPSDAFSVTLIDGVTGSGKTEVYFEAVAKALRAPSPLPGGESEPQVLILLPEIALTGDFLDRFAARFGHRPAEWHSDVPPRQRERVWRGVANGTVRAVAGARSALFLPFRNLRLIVVDEEHDPAYKQDEGVTYHARDMAVVRGHLGGFPVVLSSATPSIESRANADAGRYRRIVLPDRFAGAALPSIAAIDLRQNQPARGRWLAPPLVSAITETLAGRGQALLFLNRRGYAPLTLCRTCGHRFQCPNCSTWLVEHRFRGQLVCHHCGHGQPTPHACPQCGAADSLVACGPGVERLAEEVAARWPDARTTVLSSDMLGGVQRLRRELQAIAEGEADIVIGTQLVAKGHNFPLLRLVGVVDADLGLAHGDLRAAERTFQLLSQVTGRAGRVGGDSRAFLQTTAPDHPVMQAIVAGDREAFYARETEARRDAALPPFARLAALIVSGPDRDSARGHASALRRTAPSGEAEGITIFGPSEAPLAVIRGRHRYRMLVHAPRSADLQAWLRTWLAAAPKPHGSVRVQVDIDPQSFV
ncbi:MAG: primosomal protein N' [Bauldia sp.]|nr:primosomal protein N' [Bauldia sp.]